LKHAKIPRQERIMENTTDKGVYTLVISVPSNSSLYVGRLGHIVIPKGLYLYTGSAIGPGGLKGRIRRHLRRKKKKFWHIDYLLSSKNVSIKAIVYSSISSRLECKVNGSLSKFLSAPVKGFGSSDCANSCTSHLLRYNGRSKSSLINFVRESYRRCGLVPIIAQIWCN